MMLQTSYLAEFFLGLRPFLFLERLDEIARDGNPKMSTLSLTLRKMCPIWSPPFPGPLTPQCEHERPFHQFATLAKAPELRILLDLNWLHRDHHDSFQRFVKHPDRLAGFPTWRHYSKERYRMVDDWLSLKSGAAEHADTDALTEDEADEVLELPPVYGECSKRPRQVSTSMPSTPAKRVRVSPYEEYTQASSTNVATPSPKRSPSSARPSPDPHDPTVLSPLPMHCTAASSECSQAPIALQAHSPRSSFLAASSQRPSASRVEPFCQPQLEEAIASLLPDMLGRLLPSVLPRLLTATSPTPSSPQSIASQISHAPPPPKLSVLGMSLHDQLASTIEGEIEGIYAHTLSHASWLRTAADDEFTDLLETERLALDRVAESKFEELKQQCEDLEEDVLDRVGQKAEDLCDGVTEQMAKDRLGLEKAMRTLIRDIEGLRKDKEGLIRDKEELGRDKEELRRDKEEARRDIQELRMLREKLITSKG